MKICIWLFALFVAGMLFVSCKSVPPKEYSGLIVKITQKNEAGKWFAGTGAVIGPRRIATTWHVVDEKSTPHVRLRGSFGRKIKWAKFKVITIVDNNDLEPFVIIESDEDVFCEKDAFKIGTGPPCEVLTRRGRFNWSKYVPKPGDSGSPVVNDDMELIGIIYGWRRQEGEEVEPLMIPVKND